MTETQHTTQQASGHWDRYWAGPRVAACFEGSGANYDADISREWQELFRQLLAGGRVLDIGTGNGAIALIAREVSVEAGLDLRITGIDSAAIDPPRFLRERGIACDGIDFRGGVDAAALPFPDASFDAICSQYSVEYMEREPVLRELHRVAAPGALLQLVVHASPGVAERAAREELALRDFLLEELRITDKARRTQLVVARLERAGQPPSAEEDERARRLLNSFETALTRLQKRIAATGGHPMLENTLGVLVRSHQQRRQFSEEQLDNNITAVELEIESHAARLRELCAAACDAGAMQRLCEQVREAGFDQPTTRALLRSRDGAQLGWLLESARN